MRKLKIICIVTTGQPSTNPRVVKEADALSEAGYEVHVIGSHWTRWADDADKILLPSQDWSFRYVGGSPTEQPIYYWWTRIRHKLGRLAVGVFGAISPWVEWAVGRVLVDLRKAAEATPADLYIAHYLPALVAVSSAVKKFDSKLGFDAEDFHRGQVDNKAEPLLWDLTRCIEEKYIPSCDYMTVASPLIGEAYQKLFSSVSPVTLLNVFPMSSRPKSFRISSPSGPLKLFWFSQSVGGGRGIEDAVKAIGEIGDDRLQLHILGNFLPGYAGELRHLAKTSGVDESQIISHSPLPPDKLIEFSSQFDIGLSLEQWTEDLNRDKCLTNKIFTYLLAGNAVIATATTAQQMLATSLGEAAWFYKPGDISGLSTGIRRWLENRDELNKARLKAWQTAENMYNWDIEQTKLIDTVSRVLAVDK